MRRLAAPASAALAIAMAVLAMVTALPAGASTPLQDAAAAINRGQNVFVSSAVPGYSQALANIAPAQSSPTVLVELSATDILGTGGDGQQFADALDAATGYKYIVAVAFVSGTPPNETATYNTATKRLPAGLATSLLTQAESAGRGPESTLSNFAHFTDDTLSGTPSDLLPILTPATSNGSSAPGPTVSSKSSTTGKIAGFVFLGLLIVVLVAVFVLFLTLRGRRRVLAAGGSVEMNYLPSNVEKQLRLLLDLRLQIKDTNMRDQITQLAKDANSLFRKLRLMSKSDVNPEASKLEGYITRMIEVLEKYIEVQNNRSDYPNPDHWLGAGQEALDDFAGSVHTNLLRAGEQELMEYQVKTRILSATKYN